jgi:hypothetical protein
MFGVFRYDSFRVGCHVRALGQKLTVERLTRMTEADAKAAIRNQNKRI